MTPEALAEALRLRLPNTEIALGDKPGRVVVKMAPKPQALTIYVALSKSGDRVEISDADLSQRPRDRDWGTPFTTTDVMNMIVWFVDDYTTQDPRRPYHNRPLTIEPRIRAWAGLPDMPPSLKDRARALLAADRAALAKLRKEVVLHEEDIAALERALEVTP